MDVDWSKMQNTFFGDSRKSKVALKSIASEMKSFVIGCANTEWVQKEK